MQTQVCINFNYKYFKNLVECKKKKKLEKLLNTFLLPTILKRV